MSIHPVDVLKTWCASAGVEIAPEREAELRAICDEEVCARCHQPVHSGECGRVITRVMDDGIKTKDGCA